MGQRYFSVSPDSCKLELEPSDIGSWWFYFWYIHLVFVWWEWASLDFTVLYGTKIASKF